VNVRWIFWARFVLLPKVPPNELPRVLSRLFEVRLRPLSFISSLPGEADDRDIDIALEWGGFDGGSGLESYVEDAMLHSGEIYCRGAFFVAGLGKGCFRGC